MDQKNDDKVMNDDDDDISTFLEKIKNKYSGNAEQKHLNQMYDIGILCVNKSFNRQKMIKTLTKLIDERSKDPVKQIRDNKRAALIEAFKKGIDDASSHEYRLAYDNSNKYQYNKEKLLIRARIDKVVDNF